MNLNTYKPTHKSTYNARWCVIVYLALDYDISKNKNKNKNWESKKKIYLKMHDLYLSIYFLLLYLNALLLICLFKGSLATSELQKLNIYFFSKHFGLSWLSLSLCFHRIISWFYEILLNNLRNFSCIYVCM